jgi:hypothetical protein
MRPYTIAEASDGNLLIGGEYLDPYGYKNWLVKMDVETHEEVWRRMYTLPDYPTADDQNLYALIGIAPLDNGDIMLASDLLTDTSTALTWVFTVGPDGCRDDMDCTFDGSFVVPTQEVEESADVSLSMYPNPFTDDIVIDLPLLESPVLITLSNSTGVNIASIEVPAMTNTYSYDGSSLRSGIYYLTASTAGGSLLTRKMIKL